MNGNKWIEWAALNLAYKAAEEDVRKELLGYTSSEEKVDEVINSIKTSPIFSATQKIANDVEKWTLLSDALISLDAQKYNPIAIPRLSSLSSEHFHQQYYCANQPVIITDIVDKWPAYRKWNLDYLSENYGDNEVLIQSGRDSRNYKDSFSIRSTKVIFSDYINQLKSNKDVDGKYLIAHDRLLDKPPFNKLIRDIVFDPGYFNPYSTAGRVFFWLGPIGSNTPMHRDLANVYFCQIMGRKKVKLISSKALHLVYNESGYHSEVDFENIDYEKFPKLKNANIIEEIINPGEFLFIPVGWWHSVSSLDTTITITGNNFSFPNTFNSIF